MPFPWQAALAIHSQDATTAKYGDLKVQSDFSRRDNERRVLVFDGHVTATYGEERVTADHLEVHEAPTDMFGAADGHVLLTDPDGTVSAAHIRFSYNPSHRMAHAEEATVHVAGVIIKAAKVELVPGKYTLDDFTFAGDQSSHPLYELTGKRIVIYPGKYARATDPTLRVLGNRIIGLAHQSFNLDPRSTGVRPPNIEYRRGAGFGYSWSSGVLVNQSTDLEVHSDAFPGSRPGSGAELIKSFVAPDRSLLPIAPRTEFAERFLDSYFTNVLVKTPEHEAAYYSSWKNSISTNTLWNAGVTARGATNEVFSIPGSVTYELGGKVGKGAGFMSDLRFESIELVPNNAVFRGEWFGSFEGPIVPLGSSLSLTSRTDAGLYQRTNTFGWARITEGLVFRPAEPLTLGVGGYTALQGGTPEFDIDPLYSKTGYALRGDVHLGPRRFSIMTEYDTVQKWFDHQFVFTQAMGSLEAFVIYRRYPSQTSYGIRLRLEPFESLLKTRSFKRPSQTLGNEIP